MFIQQYCNTVCRMYLPTFIILKTGDESRERGNKYVLVCKRTYTENHAFMFIHRARNYSTVLYRVYLKGRGTNQGKGDQTQTKVCVTLRIRIAAGRYKNPYFYLQAGSYSRPKRGQTPKTVNSIPNMHLLVEAPYLPTQVPTPRGCSPCSMARVAGVAPRCSAAAYCLAPHRVVSSQPRKKRRIANTRRGEFILASRHIAWRHPNLQKKHQNKELISNDQGEFILASRHIAWASSQPPKKENKELIREMGFMG